MARGQTLVAWRKLRGIVVLVETVRSGSPSSRVDRRRVLSRGFLSAASERDKYQ